MNKKSQTELLGISIVVIILSIGLLILVSNAMKSSKTVDQKREFSEKQLATNIMGAILSTSTNCRNDKISTLLIDCGNCGETGACQMCPSESAGELIGGVFINQNYVCTYLNDTISYMLDNTLNVWHKKYQFLVYKQRSNPQINITHNISECLGGSQYLQKDFYYLPLYPDTLNVELSLCS